MKHIATLLLSAILLCGSRPVLANCDRVGHVPQKTQLFHGSTAALFEWRDTALNPQPPFRHPNSPDGPAWFALNRDFSLHAGVRYVVGTNQDKVTLHTYQVQQQGGIAALVCDDHNSFYKETKIPVNDDVAMAMAFCGNYAKTKHYNAYVIQHDRVRREPEVIICNPTTVVKYTGSEDWNVHRDVAHHTYTIGKFGPHNVVIEAYQLDLGPRGNDLANFHRIH